MGMYFELSLECKFLTNKPWGRGSMENIFDLVENSEVRKMKSGGGGKGKHFESCFEI